MTPPKGSSGSWAASSLTRRWSLAASARRASLEEAHVTALHEFRARIAAAQLQLPPALLVNGDLDATLLRFLRARKFNVGLALAMLEKSLAWRAERGADTVLEHPLEARLTAFARQCRPSSYIGFDAEHHPIFVERLGCLDPRVIEREGLGDDVIIDYHLREMEFMAQVVFSEASASAGHTVDRVVTIMDAAGLTLGMLTGFAMRLFRLIMAMDSDNYPECCHAIYIVNAGATFGAIWRCVAPFVDKGTRDKVHVLGGGRHMQHELAAKFGPALVPSFLGGSLDYESVRGQWLAKMDAAIQQRQAAPRGAQPPIVLQMPGSYDAATNGHAPHGRSGSSSSGLPKLHFAAAGGRLERGSSDTDGWATPLSAASRFSACSAATEFFDPLDGPPAPSPGGSGGGSPTAAGAEARSGVASPLAPGSAGGGPGSLSVGPHSVTRSQLSGFTGIGPGGAGGGASGGGAGADSRGAASPQSDAQLDGAAAPRQQPVCGCRCVIS